VQAWVRAVAVATFASGGRVLMAVQWEAGSGDWSVGSNWSSGSAPTASSDVVINNTGSYENNPGVTIDAQTSAYADALALNTSNLTAYGSLSIGGALTLSSSYLVLVGGSLTAQTIADGGGLDDVYGYGVVDASVASGVYVEAHGGRLVLDGALDATYSGLFIEANSTLELTSGGAGYVEVQGQNATLQLDSPASFFGNIQGVAVSDTLDLHGLVATSVSYSGATLIVHYGDNQSLAFSVSGSLTGDTVVAFSDGANGTDISWRASVAHSAVDDFNGDAHSDIVFEEAGGSPFSVWDMTSAGAGLQEQQNAYSSAVAPGWSLVGGLDFNGDGVSDLLFRNAGSGAFTIWDSTKTGFQQNAYVDGAVDSSWSVDGIGDFNGDGKSDLLWRNTSGTFTEWQSNGSGFTENVLVDSSVSTAWHIQGIGDFNGDGKDDILWRNDNGTVTEWQSTGSGFSQNVYKNSTVDTTWHIAGVGDFNGDGKDDILWRNDNGTFSIWDSTGAGFTENSYVDSTVDPSWTVAEIGDFNGDGKADILWRNTQTGAFTVWTSTGSGFDENALVDTSVATHWNVVSLHYDIV